MNVSFPPANPARSYLIRQFETAWKLAAYHLDGLTTEECLWRPARRGLHVSQGQDALWRADWPDREGYDIGPPSIAWLTWHIGFWWSMVLDHSFGNAALSRD
ncbi:MAG: DinB family protein, partial [Candidatus Binataceae bacterium]